MIDINISPSKLISPIHYNTTLFIVFMLSICINNPTPFPHVIIMIQLIIKNKNKNSYPTELRTTLLTLNKTNKNPHLNYKHCYYS